MWKIWKGARQTAGNFGGEDFVPAEQVEGIGGYGRLCLLRQ